MRFLILALVLVSCNPSKKAHRFASSNPNEFADFCAQNFPVHDSTFIKDSVHFDTLYLENQPVIETTYLRDTVFKTVYYPGSTQVITKYVKRDSIIIRRDYAAEKSLEIKRDALIINNKDLIAQRDGYKGKYNWWKLVCLITWAVILVFIVGKIWAGAIIGWVKNLIK